MSTTKEFEPAPENKLPTWEECKLRVANSEYVDKRIASGGYGYEEEGYYANELHKFIYEYDDADPYKSAWFMHRLEKLIEFVRLNEHEALKHDLDRAMNASTKEATDLTACLQRQYETSSLMADQEAWIKRIEQEKGEMLKMMKDSARLAGDAILARDPYIGDRLKRYISAAHALIAKIELDSEAEGK